MDNIEKEKISSELKTFFLSEFPPPQTEFTNTSDLAGLFLNDSLRVLTTVIHLEQQYGISLDGSDVNAEIFENIDSLSSFVLTKLRS
jgi:acyl carrier protein